jgi:hypothetical protein
MRPHRTVFAAALACCVAVAVLAQTATPTRVRGTIDAIDAKTMSVTARDGQKVTLAVAPDIGVTAIIATSITDIKPGSYIGTAAMPQPDGTLLAREIQVFPESMRGVARATVPGTSNRRAR